MRVRISLGSQEEHTEKQSLTSWIFEVRLFYFTLVVGNFSDNFMGFHHVSGKFPTTFPTTKKVFVKPKKQIMIKQIFNLCLRAKNPQGIYTVAIRYYSGGEEKYLNTEYRTSREDWDVVAPKRGQASEAYLKSEEIRKAVIEKIQTTVAACGDDLSFERFSASYKGERIVSSRTWLTLLDKHLEMKDKDYTFGTKRVYGATRAILAKMEIDGVDLSLQSFKTEEDYKALEETFKSGKYGNIGRTAVAIHMQNIKAIAETGYKPNKKLQWITSDAFKEYKKPSRKVGTFPNSLDDFNRIKNFDMNMIPIKKWTQTDTVARQKEAYGFACDFWSFMIVCGGMEARSIAFLRWSDVLADCFRFIRVKSENTAKNPVQVIVKLSPFVKQIIEKYGNKQRSGFVFPILQDGMNEEEKENAIVKFHDRVTRNVQRVAKILGINPLPSCKRTRPTFAVLSDALGLTIEEQQMLMGHSSIKTTEIYRSHLPMQRKIDASDKWATAIS